MHNKKIDQMFAGIAKEYDRHNHFFSLGLDIWWRKQLLEKISLYPKANILDLAAGTLDVSAACLKKYPQSKVLAIDFCPAMLEQGLHKIPFAQRKRLNLIAGDALHLPVADNSQDIVLISFGIRNINPRIQALGEILRVLRHSGMLCCLELGQMRSRWLNELYQTYLTKIMPSLAGLMGSDAAAYRYLAASIQAFPAPQLFEAEFKTAGFANTGWFSWQQGAVNLHYGFKR